tara:strand:+ start:8982 stop:10889 length:1908 start_codon:yes stop_codon:yes gene_type:complete
MATKVDELVVQIKADTKQLARGLDSVKNKVGSLDKSTGRSLITFKKLAGVLAAIGIVKIGQDVIRTSRTFEDLNATLRAITGSTEAAAKSMQLIKTFTATTTFQLENVTTAFTTLLNSGITPTSDVLQDFGNFAAAFGKDITQMAQAVFGATTGEMEMLKQFGIKARIEGDNISATFREVETVIGRDSASIVEYLRSIGREEFGTALEERAKTVSGAFSNLGDATALLFNEVGESGLNEALTRMALGLIDIVNAGRPLAAALGAGINAMFSALGTAIDVAKRNAKALKGALTLIVTSLLLSNVGAITRAFSSLAVAIMASVKALARFMLRNPVTFFLTLGSVVAIATGNLDALGGALEEVADGVDALLAKVGLGNMFEGLDELLGMDDTGDVAKNMKELDAELAALLTTSAAVSAGLSGNLKGVAEEFDSMNEAIISSTQQMTASFVESLMEGQSALAGFKNFAKSMVSQIIATFLNLAVVNHILNSIFGQFGMAPLPTINIFGGGGGGTGPAGPIVRSGIPATGPPAFVGPSPLARAGGGSISNRNAYLVGERGPELFVPNSAGSIKNNADTRSSMSGSQPIVINQSLNFSTGVVPTVRAEIERMLPQISEVTKASVLEASMRGGSYRRGLLGT